MSENGEELDDETVAVDFDLDLGWVCNNRMAVEVGSGVGDFGCASADERFAAYQSSDFEKWVFGYEPAFAASEGCWAHRDRMVVEVGSELGVSGRAFACERFAVYQWFVFEGLAFGRFGEPASAACKESASGCEPAFAASKGVVLPKFASASSLATSEDVVSGRVFAYEMLAAAYKASGSEPGSECEPISAASEGFAAHEDSELGGCVHERFAPVFGSVASESEGFALPNSASGEPSGHITATGTAHWVSAPVFDVVSALGLDFATVPD